MAGPTVSAIVSALIAADPGSGAFPVLEQGGAEAQFPVTVAPCTQSVAPGEIDAVTVRCGTVSVPEDHDTPDGRRIELSFVVYKSFSKAPARDALVYLHGGPGSGVVERIDDTSFLFNSFRARRDLVAFDQRGVDASGGGTRCYQAIAEFYPAMLEVPLWEPMPDILTTDLVETCVAELNANGVGIAHYNTVQNARDVPAVMAALGYPSYNIFGISYGTRLGLEVMRTAPQGLRSVVLDSVWPADIAFYDQMGVPWAEALNDIFVLCEADPDCAASYPDLRDRFHALVAALDEAPMQTAEGPLSGAELIHFLLSRNILGQTPPGLTAFTPLMIELLEAGDPSLLVALFNWEAGIASNLHQDIEASSALKASERALAHLALDLEDGVYQQQDMARRVLSELESARRATSGARPLVTAFREEANRATQILLEANPERFAAQGRAVLALRGEAPSKQALLEVVANGFPPNVSRRLTGLVELMGAQDIEAVFDNLVSGNRHIDQRLTSLFDQLLFACQEDVPLNSVDGVVRVTQALRLPPKVQSDAIDTGMSVLKHCDAFDPINLPKFHAPVVSDLPVLVLTGTNDIQTAASWGPHAAQTLSNSQVAVVPDAGHAVIAFSDCARDLSIAFVEAPDNLLDMSCLAGDLPRFVIP